MPAKEKIVRQAVSGLRLQKGNTRLNFALCLVSALLLGLLIWYFAPVSEDPHNPPEEWGDTPPAGLTEDQPKLVFLIDDIGYHLAHVKKLIDLGPHVTYAVLPLLPYSQYFGNLGKTTGAEVLLHLPLETVDGTIPGRGLITRNMPPAQTIDMLDRNLESVPGASGANSHMGSLGTTDPVLMTLILGEIKQRGLFFIDSRTTADTVVPQVARQIGVPVLSRDVFLDNIDAKQAIRQQLRQLKAVARRRGYAVGIGHYRDNTLEILKKEIPAMQSEGFEITTPGKLIQFLQWKKYQESKQAPAAETIPDEISEQNPAAEDFRSNNAAG